MPAAPIHWLVVLKLAHGLVHARVGVVAIEKATARALASEAAGRAFAALTGAAPDDVRVLRTGPRSDRQSPFWTARLAADPTEHIDWIEIYRVV